MKRKRMIIMSKRLGKFLAGIGVGVGLGFLLAPEKGEETRKKLKKQAKATIEDLKEIDYNEVKDNLLEKISKLEEEVKALNKEKVVALAKEKGDVLKKKADELYKEAVKQGKPYAEKAAKEAKDYAATTLKKVVSKLEKEDK